ncbi:MAG: YeeE/YedE [Rhodospirillaceae bacterium TMED167]|nr:YeeE/YedE [Rhodospirillaceae bacterium]OUW28724.1 MAG: YeeE/YedE [Rhodospirillaceae bacterium TMED167]
MTFTSALSVGARRMLARTNLLILLLAVVGMISVFVGARFGLVLALGLALGMTLEGLRFGFAGPWRALILRREPAGVVAQLAAIGGVAIIAFPLLASNPAELVGAHAPVGLAMVAGAFIFGLSMQLVLGCGSGTLVNAGSGNTVGLLVLPFFAIGSFAGSYNLDWWIDLGTTQTLTLTDLLGPVAGLAATLLGLSIIALIALRWAPPEQRKIPRRLWVAAATVTALAVLHLIVSGQPWGVVYGLGLWTAKVSQLFAIDLTGSLFWAAPVQQVRLTQTIFSDVTSLTNIGLILGSFAIATWRGDLGHERIKLPLIGYGTAIIAGLLMGYSSRLAFGCNVGAFFSGISTGSLHGWAWFVAAFVGSFFGVRLRPLLGLEQRPA